MSKLLVHRAALTNIVRRIALGAGEIILDYHDAGGFQGAEEKGDGSPVTQADRAAEDHIITELQKVVTGVPVVAEEMAAAGQAPDVDGAEYLWLVDALDGTRDFIAGGDEFTVNIALIKHGVPVLGVVYAPLRGELYAGWHEEDGSARAIRWLEESGKEKDIQVRAVPRAGMTVLYSKNRVVSAELDAYLAQFKIEKILKRSSSLKLCVIAAGKADLYPCFGETGAWDIAAGQAVLCAAGGQVLTRDGQSLRYNLVKAPYANPGFVAAGSETGEIP